MFKKTTITTLAVIAVIAVATTTYLGHNSAQPADAVNVGPVPARTGSSYLSPKVQVNADTGDRLDWDFRYVESPYRERDQNNQWVDGVHVLKRQHCQDDHHPDDHYIGGKRLEDFGLTDVGDNGYHLRGTFTTPPTGNKAGWKYWPEEDHTNGAGTERRIKWKLFLQQRSKSDFHSLPTSALKTDGSYAGPKEHCYYGQTYRLIVTHRIQIEPTPTPARRPARRSTPAPTVAPTQAPGGDCTRNLRYSHWHNNPADMSDGSYNWNDHRGGGYGDTNCMSPDEREEYGFNKTGVHRSRVNPKPHDHNNGANRH